MTTTPVLTEKLVLTLLEAGLDAAARGVKREDILAEVNAGIAAGKTYDEITADVRAIRNRKLDELDRVAPPAT